jgi:glycosyltransferase involved in cell wall biosynthesis
MLGSNMMVSVVISVYNGERFLRDAIDSILNQDMDSFELIVVDDGSTDGTPQILSEYDDPRLSRHRLPINCGQITARNLGMALVTGKYMAVMDADDVAFPNRLSLQLQYMEENLDVDILGCRIVRTKESINDEIDRPNHPVNDGEIKSLLLALNGSALSHPSMMARMEFLRKNNLIYSPCPRGRNGSDHQFFIKCVKMGAKFSAIPDVLLYKRRHQDNVSLSMYEEGDRRTFTRAELLSLYYPELKVSEINSLALLLQEKKQFSAMEVCEGVVAGKKALESRKSIYGESHEVLNSIILNKIKAVLSHFSKVK